jgi:hypothetical protein
LDKQFTTNRRLQISLALDFLWSYHYCRVFEGNSLLTLMRTSLATYLWAPVACLILFVAFASNAAETTVASILANPAQYDGKIITVRGIATAVKPTVSRRGNPYTTLRLQDGGSEINTRGAIGAPAR